MLYASFTAKMQEIMFDYDVLVTDNGCKKFRFRHFLFKRWKSWEYKDGKIVLIYMFNPAILINVKRRRSSFMQTTLVILYSLREI